jgi:hypothetical protein
LRPAAALPATRPETVATFVLHGELLHRFSNRPVSELETFLNSVAHSITAHEVVAGYFLTTLHKLRAEHSPHAEQVLQRFAELGAEQCAYYGHGSCPYDPDACQVCCWMDDDPDPWCYCEDCLGATKK